MGQDYTLCICLINTGHKSSSEVHSLETVPQHPVTDPDVSFGAVVRNNDYCKLYTFSIIHHTKLIFDATDLRAQSVNSQSSQQETSTYTPLLPRTVAEAIYMTATSHKTQGINLFTLLLCNC